VCTGVCVGGGQSDKQYDKDHELASDVY